MLEKIKKVCAKGKKIEDVKENKTTGTYNISKDETSNSGNDSSGYWFWDLINKLYPR